jgi:hypothetical protein
MRSTILAAFVLMVPAVAQGQVQSYDTYSEALEGVLSLSRDLVGCRGLVSYDADMHNASGMPPVVPDGFFQLSPALQRHCIKQLNGQTGATTAGGFSEPFSTRTFLPFTSDFLRPSGGAYEIPDRSKRALSLGRPPGQAATRIVGDGAVFSFGLQVTDLRSDTTEFELG